MQTTTTLSYSASCKLMLFGEYLVLQGAKSLALPLKYGQRLTIAPSETIKWTSESPSGIWFEAEFSNDLDLISSNDTEVSDILLNLFELIASKKPDLNLVNNYHATADFNLSWGLGSSSTLISLLSQWSEINPFELLKNSFGGSGYDIACATSSKPIVFQKLKDHDTWQEIDLDPKLTDHFLFVYLGQKQNSRNEIKRFQSADVTPNDIDKMNQLVDAAVQSESIDEFENLIDQAEELLSPIIGKEKLKEHIFADYQYSIKSLGAWGGDFFLATHRNIGDAKEYFMNKGYSTMFTYNEMAK